jgi:drug/metabolite transporter (DMT)-like permease
MVKGIPFLALLIVSAFWGGHAVVGKAVEAHLTALPLTVWRFTLGAVCYLPFYHRVFRIFHLPRIDFWRIVCCGICWAVLYPLFYYQSLHYLTPVVSLLLVNTSPLLAAILGRLLFREFLSVWGWSGIGVSFMGVLLLVLRNGTGRVSIIGILLAFIAASAFALYTVLSRSLFRSLPLADVLTTTSLFGVIILWGVTLVSGKAGFVFHALGSLPPQGWGGLLYIVLIVSTIAYVLYGYGLKRVPSGIASAVTFYPQVPFAAAIEWIVYGIVPGTSLIASAVLILTGTAIMGKKAETRKRERSELA